AVVQFLDQRELRRRAGGPRIGTPEPVRQSGNLEPVIGDRPRAWASTPTQDGAGIVRAERVGGLGNDRGALRPPPYDRNGRVRRHLFVEGVDVMHRYRRIDAKPLRDELA